MSDFFTLKSVSGDTRVGELKTRAGVVRTPVFMPVGTRGAVKGLQPEQVADTGAQIILGNTYHLHLQPGEKVIAALGGLHTFTKWSGPILTDSGGFQVFSLARSRKITEEGVTFKDPKTGDTIMLTPEKSMQIQIELGSDIIMAFDDVVSLDQDGRDRAKEALERTHRWLERCITEFKHLTKEIPKAERPLFFGIAQGGLDKELRRQSLEFVQSCDVDGVAIGGLSVGETRAEMHDMLEFLAPLYDPQKAHYLMGVGDPIDFRFAIEHGIDMMDCVLATRNARHGTAWIRSGCTTTSCQSAELPAPKSFAAHRSGEVSSTPSPYQEYGSVRASNSSGAALACNRCGEPLDKKIHLTNEKYRVDQSPIDPTCDCAACTQGFSRGFLRHQFKVKESLAGSLVSIHNIRYLNRVAEEYRTLS